MLEAKKRGFPRAKIAYKPALEAFTSVGCYPIVYWDLKTQDGYCATCATEKRNRGASLTADVYYEGPGEDCCECGEIMHSAYGDPEATEV